MAYGILVPPPGIKPAPLALDALNHWTAREIPLQCFLIYATGKWICHQLTQGRKMEGVDECDGRKQARIISFKPAEFEMFIGHPTEIFSHQLCI